MNPVWKMVKCGDVTQNAAVRLDPSQDLFDRAYGYIRQYY